MPLKVDSRSTQEAAFTRLVGRDERVTETDTDFSTELLEQEDSLSTEQLDKLLKQIDEQGARLSKSPDLRRFPGRVGDFCNLLPSPEPAPALLLRGEQKG